jgi:hypothetical protein
MYEIFINYRRVDTTDSGGHLYSDLWQRFGRDAVFMDTRRSIPWGADWDSKLKDALENCEVLVALIGPRWTTCERSPGKRALDEPDDWVRDEIATALKRSKKILPVLLGRDTPPSESELPAELTELRFHLLEAYPISQTHWEEERDHLVSELNKNPKLKEMSDLKTGERGIRLLEKLIRENSKVADTVSRSRVVIEITDRGVDEIRLLKNIHDALHEIEAKSLEPIRDKLRRLRESNSNIGETVTIEALGDAHRKFVRYQGDIGKSRGQLAEIAPSLSGLLGVELPERLESAKLAFANVANTSTPADLDHLVGELEGLAGSIPARLNDEIERAMRQLELHQLRDLMTAVIGLLDPKAVTNRELKPMVNGTAALDNLRKNLASRVRDHGLLQGLDNKLRSMFEGQYRDRDTWKNANRANLNANWNSIQRLRERFTAPFSPVLEVRWPDLEPIEAEIKTVIARGDETNAILSRLESYAKEVGGVFREVDSNLKEFCGELRENTLPLKAILQQCEPEPENA